MMLLFAIWSNLVIANNTSNRNRCEFYDFGDGLEDDFVNPFWETYVPNHSEERFTHFVLTDGETWADPAEGLTRTTYTEVGDRIPRGRRRDGDG